MQWIYSELRGLDRLILSSPIFFMGPTAQTKAMIDRCQALWVLKYVLKLPLATNGGGERNGLFLSVGGTKFSNLFQPSKTIVTTFFRILDISYTSELLYPGIDEKGAINSHPTALKDALMAGQKLVEE